MLRISLTKKCQIFNNTIYDEIINNYETDAKTKSYCQIWRMMPKSAKLKFLQPTSFKMPSLTYLPVGNRSNGQDNPLVNKHVRSATCQLYIQRRFSRARNLDSLVDCVWRSQSLPCRSCSTLTFVLLHVAHHDANLRRLLANSQSCSYNTPAQHSLMTR